MAFEGDIGLRVRAVGLQEDIARQANAAQRTLNRNQIRLSLDDRSFRQPLGRITGDMSEFQKSLDASTARVFAFGATVGIINGIADGFRATVDAVIQVEKALADINVVMGLSAEQLQSFSDGLFEVAKNTSQTFETVTNAAVEFARQGLGAEETLRRVNDALILTRLSGLDSAKAVEALTAVVNGFGKAGLNTSDVINRLANVDAAFAVSSKDLADALARSGATAQDAGVSFNELLAVVTSVQQQTARGGAVIGNAFKSIFTRLQRSGVRQALEEIGVATTDSFGNFRSAIDILKDYAKVYDTLTDAQQAYTAEQIAGVYQINNLKALVSDLNREFSIYGQALSQAANTTDEAVQRNEELNKTFAAMAVQAGQSLTQLAQAFGELSLEPAMEKVLGIIQTVVDSMNSMLGEGDGDNLMSKFFKGMGNFISGPGLALVSAAFGKLFMTVVKHATDAFKEMFKITTETQRQKALQESILNILMKDEQAYRKITSAAGDQNRQAQILLGIIRQINSEYANQQQLISSLARSPALRGVAPGPQGFTGVRPQTRTSAKGFNPEQKKTFAEGAIPEIEASVSAGYVNTVQPQQVRQMNIPQIGNIMYNTQERVVKMPNVAQPFIVPPTSSKAYPSYANTVKENFGEKMGNMVLGRAFTPAQRSFAEGLNPTAQYNSIIEQQSAKGLVPNYAVRAIRSRKAFDELGLGRGVSFKESIIQPQTSKKIPIIEGGSNIRLNKDIANILKSGGKNPDLELDGSNFKSGYKYEFEYDGKTIVATGKEFKELFSKSESGEYSIRKESRLAKAARDPDARDPDAPRVHKINEDVSMLVPLPMGNAATQENVIISGQELLKTISLTEIKKLGLVPKDKTATGIKEKLKNNLINDTFQVGFKTSGIQEFDDNVTLRDAIDRDMGNAMSGIIKNNANKVLGSKSSTFKLNTADIDARAKSLVQQNSSLAGFLFEEVITSAISRSSAFDGKDQYRRWDFGAGDKPALNEIFDRAVGELSDAKRTPSPLAKISIGKKSLFATPQGNRILRKAVNSANGFNPDPVSFGGKKQLNKNIKNAASGIIPNFTNLRDNQKAFQNIGRKRAVGFDVDDTLMHTSKSVEEMGLSGRDKYKGYNDPEISKQIAKTAPLTPLGKRIQNLKNKDDVFILTAASPYRNSVLADRFGIPENKILSLQDQKIIQQFGLDQKKPSKRGISRREKDPSYQLGTKADDFRKLNTGEQKRKILDSFVKKGIRPTLYDDNLEVLKEAGQYGRRVQYAAEGLVPNFANYIFDADVVGAKNSASMQKAILASPVKKNLMFGPSGSGKTTVARERGGIFLRTVGDITKLNPLIDEITMLSGSAKTKAGGLSKPAQALLDAANSSGGRISYVYVPNDEIISRRNKRVESPFELDTRGKKQLKGTRYAPRNQFDFIQQIKNSSDRFSLIKNFAEGLVPNFASRDIKSISASNNSSANLIAALDNGEMVSKWPGGETRQVKEIKNNKDLLSNRTISLIFERLIAKEYNNKALKYGSHEEYERVYKSLSPKARKLLARPFGREGNIGLFESLDKSHELLDGQYVPEVARRMRRVLEGENIRSGGLTGPSGEWGDLRHGNIMVKKGALQDPKIQKIREQALANNKIPMNEVVDYLWKKGAFKIIDASLVVNKPIHPKLQFLEGGKARAKKEDLSGIQASHLGIKFSEKGYGKEGNLHYVDTFDEESKKVFKEILEEHTLVQQSLQKRMPRFGAGLVPNLAGRGDNKETSSRIYESVLATNSYGMNVPFEDTRVENIEINGQKQPVAVNSREKIFKTGKDVQRHFGLDSRPSGGMVLAPQNTAAGKENRKEFASKVENAAEGIVPNFADNAYDLMLKNNPNEKIDLHAIQNSLDKQQNGLLYQAKTAKQINLKVTTKSLEKLIKQFGPSVSVDSSKFADWAKSNRRDFSSLAKAHNTFKAIGAGTAAKSFKESQQEYEEENRKKHVEKNIIAAYPHKGSPRPQRGYLKEPDGDRWQVDFLGTGIKKESLNNENANLKNIINNEFSVALEKVSEQFKFSGALAQLGAEAGALRTRLKNNIESTQISTITGNVFDIVIKTLAQGGREFNDQGSRTNDPIDIRNITPALNQILDIPESGATMVELKNSPNRETLNNVAYKILREKKLYNSDKKPTTLKGKGKRIGRGSMSDFNNRSSLADDKKAFAGVASSAASGYVPNFVDFSDKRFKLNELPNLPQGLQKGVSDAVQREKDAGVPASQIRVDFPSSGGMVSNFAKMPPVAITNTRDEGNFASASKSVARGIQNRQNGIRWAKASGLDMDPLTGEIAAQGLVPNFVTPKDIRTASASIKTVRQEISDSLDIGDEVENKKLLDRKKQLIKELDNQLSIAKKSGTIGDNTLSIEQNILKAHKKELKQLKTSSNKKFQRGLRSAGLQNAAFAAPMVLSMAQAFVPEKEGGTAAGMATGALSGATSAGSIASLGLGMGPYGVAFAGVVTAIGALDGMMRKAKPSAEELSAVYKNQLSENTQNINSAKQYVQAQQSLNEALDSGDIKKQQAAMKGISEAIGKIGDEKIRSKLISAGSDMEKLSSVIAELGEESRKQAKEISFFEDFRKAADKQSGWMERWFGIFGKERKNISSKDLGKFEKQLASVLNFESIEDVNKMRDEVFGPDADVESVKKSLVERGMDKSKADDLFQDAKDLEDVLNIISGTLDIEAEQIKNTKFIEAMQRNTSAIKNYDAQLIRVANSLSSEFDSIIDYFGEISNISSSVFSERVKLTEKSGLSTPQQSREKLIKFQSEQIRSSQAMQTEKFVKNFLKEVKGEDFEGKESLESEYDKALGRYGKSGDDNKLIADVLKIATRTDDKDIEVKGLEKQTELEQKMVDGIRDLNNKSTIQIAALKLNNRLAEQNRILSGARQASQMSTENVMDFKKFATILNSKGEPSITSQDQVARSITTAQSFLQSRNMEETPEFRKLAIEAQQSQILTSAARTLTAVPGLDFIDQDDPNFGFNNRDKMFEFFNLGNLKNAPTEGDNIVQQRENFFNQLNSQQSEQKYLDERLFGTQQYQDYTADMSPENQRIFDETMKSALLGYRDIIIQQEKVRQEDGIKGYEEKETKKAMLDAFESSGLDAKEFFGTEDPERMSMGEFNKSLAEALRESPMDVVMLKEERKQTTLLNDIKGSLNKDLVNYQDALESQEKIKEIRTKEQEREKQVVTGIQSSRDLANTDVHTRANYVGKSSLEKIQSNLNQQITKAGGDPNVLKDYFISDTGIHQGEGLQDFQKYLQFKNKTTSEVQVIQQSLSNVEDEKAKELFSNQLKNILELQGNVLGDNLSVFSDETPQKMVDLTKALNDLSVKIAKVNPVAAATAGQSMGYIPSFTSQTQIINELSKEPRYKDAINRERKASGSTPIIEHSKMLGMHAVYNKEQRAKYGSIDATIKRDHLAMGQDPNSLYMTGSGNERYSNNGYVPSFNTLFKQEESEAKKLGAPSNVQAHYGKGTIDGKPFVMNNNEVEITASQMAQQTGLYPKKGDSTILPNYKPEVKSELNTKIQNAGGLSLDYKDFQFNAKKLETGSPFEIVSTIGQGGIRGSLGHIPNFNTEVWDDKENMWLSQYSPDLYWDHNKGIWVSQDGSSNLSTKANLSVTQIRQKAFLESMTEEQREDYKKKKLRDKKASKLAKSKFLNEYRIINEIINKEKAQKQKDSFKDMGATQKIEFYRQKMDQFNLRIKKEKDKKAKLKIKREKGKFHTEFINAAELEVAPSHPFAESPEVKAKRLEQYLALFTAEDPEKYLEDQATKKIYQDPRASEGFTNKLKRENRKARFAPDKISLTQKEYKGQYEKLDAIPKAEFVAQGWFLPVYKNDEGNFLYRTRNEPRKWKHSRTNSYINQEASDSLSNRIDRKASENIEKIKEIIDPRTVQVVKRTLEKAASQEKFAEWYETLSPEHREIMYEEMQNAQMAEKIPPQYLTLMEKEDFGKPYQKGDNAGYLKSIGSGLPEEQKKKLINKQIQRYDDLFKQDPNKFYAYWMRQTPETREIVLKQLKDVDHKAEYVNKLKQSSTEGIINIRGLDAAKALDYKTLKSMGVKSPTRVQLWLQDGKDLREAIALAEQGKAPAQTNQSRSTKAKKFSGWRENTRPGHLLKRDKTSYVKAGNHSNLSQRRISQDQNSNELRQKLEKVLSNLSKSEKEDLFDFGPIDGSKYVSQMINNPNFIQDQLRKTEKLFEEARLRFKFNKGYVPNFNKDQKSSTNKLFHSNQASHGRHWGELSRDSYVANFQKIIKNTGIDPLNFKATREKIIEKDTPPSPIEIESKLASGLGYEAGRVKQTDNFIYNDREKLISPEYINDNRIRGLGTPMSNTEGTLAVSSAIVPPTNTLAFEKYLPNFSKQLDMPSTEARSMLNPSYQNKNFAAGGAVPKVRSVPNFAPEQKPELGENAKQLDVDINNLPVLLEAAEQFDNTVEKLGQKIKDLSTVFSQGIKNSLDANVNVNGLDQSMEVLKSEITKSIIDQIQNTNNNVGQNNNQGSSTFGTPSEIWKNAPNGNTFGGNK